MHSMIMYMFTTISRKMKNVVTKNKRKVEMKNLGLNSVENRNKEGRKEGSKEGREEGRKEGRKEGRSRQAGRQAGRQIDR